MGRDFYAPLEDKFYGHHRKGSDEVGYFYGYSYIKCCLPSCLKKCYRILKILAKSFSIILKFLCQIFKPVKKSIKYKLLRRSLGWTGLVKSPLSRVFLRIIHTIPSPLIQPSSFELLFKNICSSWPSNLEFDPCFYLPGTKIVASWWCEIRKQAMYIYIIVLNLDLLAVLNIKV